jgi:hypothetical protein
MEPSFAAKRFVALLYTALAVAFVAPFAMLFLEHGWEQGYVLAVVEPNHFVFFPLVAPLVLLAFYWPSVIFSDMYWRGLATRGARLKYWFYFALLAFAAYVIAQGMVAAGPRAAWEITPGALARDQGERCGPNGGPCSRAPIKESLLAVHRASRARVGMSPFARDCRSDEDLERPAENSELRRCFVARDRLDADRCCKAQENFRKAVDRTFERPENVSNTYYVHALTMPLKVFFLLVVLVIGLILTLRHRVLVRHYGVFRRAIERGVLVGAIAMMLWPITYFASSQTTAVLYGWASSGHAASMLDLGPLGAHAVDAALRRNLALVYGASLVPWALLLLFFFYRGLGRTGTETAARVGGILVSGVAVLRHQQLIDVAERAVGSGAWLWSIGLLILAVGGAVGLLLYYGLTRDRERPRRRDDEVEVAFHRAGAAPPPAEKRVVLPPRDRMT